MTGAGIPAPGGRRNSVMNPGETETVKENVFFVKHFSLKKASEFHVFSEGFSLL